MAILIKTNHDLHFKAYLKNYFKLKIDISTNLLLRSHIQLFSPYFSTIVNLNLKLFLKYKNISANKKCDSILNLLKPLKFRLF